MWRIENREYPKMPIIRSFRELNVYKMARQEAQTIFETTRSFPREERYALTDQIRRSSRAVKAMIAEAWGRRKYSGVFINKIDEALGEATETQSWLDDCLDCGYISGTRTNGQRMAKCGSNAQ